MSTWLAIHESNPNIPRAVSNRRRAGGMFFVLASFIGRLSGWSVACSLWETGLLEAGKSMTLSPRSQQCRVWCKQRRVVVSSVSGCVGTEGPKDVSGFCLCTAKRGPWYLKAVCIDYTLTNQNPLSEFLVGSSSEALYGIYRDPAK